MVTPILYVRLPSLSGLLIDQNLSSSSIRTPGTLRTYRRYPFSNLEVTKYMYAYSILSDGSFTRNGRVYDVTMITSSDLAFNQTAYEAYSPIYLSATFALSYGLSFASMTATISKVFQWFTLWLPYDVILDSTFRVRLVPSILLRTSISTSDLLVFFTESKYGFKLVVL